MSSEILIGIIRQVLSVLGAWLLGRNLFGATVDPALWQKITGEVLIIASFVWTVKAKQLTVEIVQSSILKIVMTVGTILVASGKVTGEYIDKIVLTVTVLAPILYSILSKKKSADIAAGEIPLGKLSK